MRWLAILPAAFVGGFMGGTLGAAGIVRFRIDHPRHPTSPPPPPPIRPGSLRRVGWKD